MRKARLPVLSRGRAFALPCVVQPAGVGTYGVSSAASSSCTRTLSRVPSAVCSSEITSPSVEIEALVPYTHGKLVARAHDEGEVISEEHTAEGTLLKVRVHEELAADLAPYVPAPVVA